MFFLLIHSPWYGIRPRRLQFWRASSQQQKVQFSEEDSSNGQNQQNQGGLARVSFSKLSSKPKTLQADGCLGSLGFEIRDDPFQHVVTSARGVAAAKGVLVGSILVAVNGVCISQLRIGDLHQAVAATAWPRQFHFFMAAETAEAPLTSKTKPPEPLLASASRGFSMFKRTMSGSGR